MTKVYFETYGCTLNFSDTELMQGLLVDVGFTIVDDPNDSEVIVVNTCAVKKPTENKFFNKLKKLEDLRRPIIIAGCIAKALPEKLKKYSLISPDNINDIVSVIEETMHDNTEKLLDYEKNPRLNLPLVRKNKIVEILPISKGCQGECTYCVVKYARGEFYSYQKEDIINQARSAINKGVKEIWVTAQDTGCYGKDLKSSLPELLNELVKLPGDFKIRVGMMNPNHVEEMFDDLVEVLKNKKLFKFVHIPVQAGNDKILKKMKRKYTSSEFKTIVKNFREAIPEITIATDVICGFPGETKEQFQDTVNLIDEIKPEVMNISRFWSRPKTAAAKLFPLSGKETKERSRKITDIFDWILFEQNKKWRNWQGEIIIDEKGRDDQWIGRNSSYKPVIVNGNYKLGDQLNVKVELVTKYDLRAVEV
jgi:threonylcarbamoyladenosine tRNA methylthiotransferase CDKAL1